MPHAIWKIYTLFNFSLSPDPRDSICQWGPTCLLESHSWLEHSVHLLALWFVPSLHCRWHHSGFSPPLLSQVLSSAQWGVSQHSTAVTVQFSSVQFSCSVVFNSLWPREPQHGRPPCPPPTPGAYPNSCPLSRWCHPTISSSVVPLSSCPQAFPASGSFQMSQLFTSSDQCIGVSASTSVPPMDSQD